MDHEADHTSFGDNLPRVDADAIELRKTEAGQTPSVRANKPDEPKFIMGKTDSATHRPFTLADQHHTELVLEFNGSAKEYFRIWIVNLCLTLLSLGIFSAWSKVRKKRFAYSHTTLDGTPFQYLAKPLPILKGRLIAGAAFVVYYISSHFLTTLVPWILGAGLILAPWVLIRSAAFNARYSAYRNMTFYFKAGYFTTFKTIYVWGIVPLIILAVPIVPPEKALILAIPFLIIAFFFPWWLCRLKRFFSENTSFGGKHLTFSATGGQFFGVYFSASLIMMAFSLPIGIFVGIWGNFSENLTLMAYIVPIVSYTGYVFAYAFIKARSGNLVYKNLRLGPVSFESTLRTMDLLKLYVTNAIGIIFSLGLLIPWAVIRTWKYRADHTRVWLDGDLTEFEGSRENRVEAIGAEALDLFDMDISI